MKTTSKYASLVAFVIMIGSITFPVLSSVPIGRVITTTSTAYAQSQSESESRSQPAEEEQGTYSTTRVDRQMLLNTVHH